jgi:hypothetical protein
MPPLLPERRGAGFRFRNCTSISAGMSEKCWRTRSIFMAAGGLAERPQRAAAHTQTTEEPNTANL